MTEEEKKDKSLFISHSSMETMEQCLLKWYLRYIEKLKPKVENHDTLLGDIIHKTIYKFEGVHTPSIAKLLQENLTVPEATPEFLEKYKPRLAKAIRNFAKFYNDRLKDIGLTKNEKERKFITPAPTEGFNLIGIMDIYFKRNNVITLLDWKTSKKESDHSEQLSYYFLLLKLLGEIPEDQNTFDAEIVYLSLIEHEDYKVEAYHLDEKDLDAACYRLESYIRRIQQKGLSKENYPKKPSALCPWCDYYKAGICNGKED
jgi:RecB family exonuclease